MRMAQPTLMSERLDGGVVSFWFDKYTANTIVNLKESTPLRDYFQRISFRKGRASAISATARKR